MKISNPIQDEAEKAAVVALMKAAKAKQLCKIPLHRISRDFGKGVLTAALGIYGRQIQIHTSRSYRDSDAQHRSVWVYGRSGVLCWEGNDSDLLDWVEERYTQ